MDGRDLLPSWSLWLKETEGIIFQPVSVRLGRGIKARGQMFTGNSVGSKQENKNMVAAVGDTAHRVFHGAHEPSFRNTWGEGCLAG